jgi:TonB family protein
MNKKWFLFGLLFFMPLGWVTRLSQSQTIIVARGDVSEIQNKLLVYLNIPEVASFDRVFRAVWTDKNGFLTPVRDPKDAELIVAFVPKAESGFIEGAIPFEAITNNAAERMVVYHLNEQRRVRVVWVDKAGKSPEQAMKDFLKAIAADRKKEIIEPPKKECEGGTATRPVITERQKAITTDEAKAERVSGTVAISVVFAIDGKLSNFRVVRGLPYGLTVAALQAAKLVRFQPATCNGKPVAVKGFLEYSFSY